MSKKKALEEYKKELDKLSLSEAEKAEMLKFYEEEIALEESEKVISAEENETKTSIESDGKIFRSVVLKTSFTEKEPGVICEKIDKLFYFMASSDLNVDEKEQVKQKIESGILRLRVLKADIEAEHYNKKLMKYEVRQKIKNKTEIKYIIGILIFVIVLSFTILIINYYTNGEFFKTKWPWEK